MKVIFYSISSSGVVSHVFSVLGAFIPVVFWRKNFINVDHLKEALLCSFNSACC
jgi:hypothetical protein